MSPATPPTERLERLCEEIGPEAVRELIDDFSRDLPLRSDELASLARRESLEACSLAAHALKGASLCFGLEPIATRLLALEQSAENGIRPDVDRIVAELPPLVDQTLHDLRSWATRKFPESTIPTPT